MIDSFNFPKLPMPERRDDDPPCPTELFAEHANGTRKQHVLLDAASARIIGRGHFAVIYAVNAKVIGILPQPGDSKSLAPFNERRRAKEFPVVIKVFFAPRNAENALSLHDVCKDAGLNVAATYRADLKKGVIIMTDFGKDDSYAIAGANWSIGMDALHKKNLEGIVNWEAVRSRLFSDPLERDAQGRVKCGSEVYRATAHAIELQPDVYFFKIPRDVSMPPAEPIAGDFDIVRHPSQKSEQALLKHNVMSVGFTCKLFIENSVRPDKQQPYLNALYAACSSVFKESSQ